MADQLLDTVRDALEAPIDFEGQRLADQLNTNALAVVGLVAFIVGYYTQNIAHTLWVGVGGSALVFLAIVPPWPYLNQSPAKWLPAKGSAHAQGISIVAS